MDYTKVDFAALLKKSCDNVTVGSNKETFALAVFCGTEVNGYTLAPAHAKRFAISLQTQLEAYERKFGTIDTNLPKPIESPIQPKDLGE